MITLDRKIEDGNTTLGVLSVDGSRFCFTCEDEGREIKVAGETRIPAGTYKIGKRTYGRFHKAYKERWGFEWVPEILDVPGFTDILIHTGNTEAHTAGCVLVGQTQDIDNMTIGGSRPAYQKLWKKLDDMFNHGENVMIKVTEEILTCKAPKQ